MKCGFSAENYWAVEDPTQLTSDFQSIATIHARHFGQLDRRSREKMKGSGGNGDGDKVGVEATME
ncbi:MAG: hypothetical protein GY847_32490 [Proteobacteria bacterium]|nr:hypothetical protein [Pseudomonadota bacterium]